MSLLIPIDFRIQKVQECPGGVWDHPRRILDHFRPILSQNRLKNYIRKIWLIWGSMLVLSSSINGIPISYIPFPVGPPAKPFPVGPPTYRKMLPWAAGRLPPAPGSARIAGRTPAYF